MSDRAFLEIWSLSFSDFEFLETYHQGSRVWIGMQLLHFRDHGHFAEDLADLPGNAQTYVGDQLGLAGATPYSVSKDSRLLLCLYGLGTNVGLKRVASATAGVSYDELLHIRRRYIDPPSLKAACAQVANATLALRQPRLQNSLSKEDHRGLTPLIYSHINPYRGASGPGGQTPSPPLTGLSGALTSPEARRQSRPEGLCGESRVFLSTGLSGVPDPVPPLQAEPVAQTQNEQKDQYGA